MLETRNGDPAFQLEGLNAHLLKNGFGAAPGMILSMSLPVHDSRKFKAAKNGPSTAISRFSNSCVSFQRSGFAFVLPP